MESRWSSRYHHLNIITCLLEHEYSHPKSTLTFDNEGDSLKKKFRVVNVTWIFASSKCLKEAANTGFNITL